MTESVEHMQNTMVLASFIAVKNVFRQPVVYRLQTNYQPLFRRTFAQAYFSQNLLIQRDNYLIKVQSPGVQQIIEILRRRLYL